MLRRSFLKSVTAACGLCIVGQPDKIITDLAQLKDSNELKCGLQELPLSKIVVDRRLDARCSPSNSINVHSSGYQRTESMLRNAGVDFKCRYDRDLQLLTDCIDRNGQLQACVCGLSPDKKSVVLITGFRRVHAIKILGIRNRIRDISVLVDVKGTRELENNITNLQWSSDCSR